MYGLWSPSSAFFFFFNGDVVIQCVNMAQIGLPLPLQAGCGEERNCVTMFLQVPSVSVILTNDCLRHVQGD